MASKVGAGETSRTYMNSSINSSTPSKVPPSHIERGKRGALSGRSGELDHVREALSEDFLDDLAQHVGDGLSNLGVDPVLNVDLGVGDVGGVGAA